MLPHLAEVLVAFHAFLGIGRVLPVHMDRIPLRMVPDDARLPQPREQQVLPDREEVGLDVPSEPIQLPALPLLVEHQERLLEHILRILGLRAEVLPRPGHELVAEAPVMGGDFLLGGYRFQRGEHGGEQNSEAGNTTGHLSTSALRIGRRSVPAALFFMFGTGCEGAAGTTHRPSKPALRAPTRPPQELVPEAPAVRGDLLLGGVGVRR